MSRAWFTGSTGTDDEPAGWLARPSDDHARQTGTIGLLRRRLAEALERTRRAEAQALTAMTEARRYKRRPDEVMAAR